MSIIGSIEATRELCANLDNLIELTKESRVPIRALSFIEQAREDLQAYLNEIEQTLKRPVESRAEGEEVSKLQVRWMSFSRFSSNTASGGSTDRPNL